MNMGTSIVCAYNKCTINGRPCCANENNHNHLDFLFVKDGVQSKGIGQAIWKEIEKLVQAATADEK